MSLRLLQKRWASTAPIANAAGRLAKFADPVVYYARVAGSFAGQVLKNQNMTTLPHFGQAQEGLGRFVSALGNGAWKSVTLGQAATVVADGVSVVGFFLVGEMVGKRSIIGYQIPGQQAHH